MDRTTAMSVLSKLDPSIAPEVLSEMPDERIAKKIANRINAPKPAGITADEITALKGAGFAVPAMWLAKPKAAPLAEEVGAAVAAVAGVTEATPSRADLAQNEAYVRRAEGGAPDKLEFISGTKAKVRNMELKKKNDPRRWRVATPEEIEQFNAPATGGGKDDDSSANEPGTEAPVAGEPNPEPKETNVKTKTNGKAKKQPTGNTPQQKAKAAADAKAAKGAGKAPAAAATAKAPAAPKAPKAPRNGANGSAAFRELFPAKGTKLSRADVIKKLGAKGVKDSTASSYIVWAKRPIANTTKNPFGFRLDEAKDEKGVKHLTRVTG